MTGDHAREQEGITMHTNFSQMLLKEHLSASQLQGFLLSFLLHSGACKSGISFLYNACLAFAKSTKIDRLENSPFNS